jgi:hypothetical protein
MIRGVCPWHVNLTPKWSAMATFELSSSSSSIMKEIKIGRLNKLNGAAKKQQQQQQQNHFYYLPDRQRQRQWGLFHTG